MNRIKLHTTLAMAVIMLALSIVELPAAGAPTSAGKEFVLCFPYNEVTPELKLLEYHLQVFITSFNGELCNVNISYHLNGELIEIEETVSGENMLKVEFPGEMEIVGHLENENKGIFITSDNDINVYGFSMCGATTDAFLCYPTAVLDTTYIVTSYQNLIYSYNKYSNIHIVAMEDDTEVTIYPTAPLEGWGDIKPEKVTIMMNKGDARQIIARVTEKYDLTGSIVNSNKKIVVYSTHQNQFVNPTIGGNTDVLIEQNLPISRLATNTIFSPTYPANKLANTVARIVSPFDDNHIKFSDATIILNKQEFYEFVYDSCLYVETSKPALFAMYCSSTSKGKDDVGPNMILLPPVEYYLNRYISVAPKYEYKFSHILNLIISDEGLKTLTINGEPVINQNYSPIYGTDYVFLWDWVEAGVHVIESDSTFGIIAHGFASADGYGYIPGMKTGRETDIVYDKSPPVAYFDNGCVGTLLLVEKGEYKTGIASLEILEIDNLKYYKDESYIDEYSERYFCELLDPLRDGFMKYRVTDVAGNSRIDSILLKGFTMTGVPPERDTIYFNSLVCREIDLANIGSYNQDFETYFLQNVVFSIPQSVSHNQVQSGRSAKLLYCMRSMQLGTMRDTLLLVDSCNRLIAIPFEVEVLPNAYAATSRCDVTLRAVTSEQHRITYEDGTLSLANFTGEISIYNLLGEQLYRRSFVGGNHNEQLDLSAGVYFLVAIGSDGRREFIKVLEE